VKLDATCSNEEAFEYCHGVLTIVESFVLLVNAILTGIVTSFLGCDLSLLGRLSFLRTTTSTVYPNIILQAKR